ncbi:EpsG family protein [Alteriqipengyuania sp. WL0013]|uniref:EpsG family protein n=1 Tax=Alteriqipengyuania sp. WL0013 TaxID=3110773 RepID=UPI002C6D07D1|nr:EpsG family protein [Alteriqipengyuania sp. WL0013]MEB3415614.1 EpsG family protein [Alteriqipengyuania sp. WL0013]
MTAEPGRKDARIALHQPGQSAFLMYAMPSTSEQPRYVPTARLADEARMARIAAIAIAALFAFLYVRGIYSFRPLIEWEDLYRYVERFSLDPYYGMTVPQEFLDYATTEYGWQLIVRGAFDAGLDFEAVFALISMIAVGLCAHAILRVTNRPAVLLLLLNPALIDFFISQVRSALAVAIVLNFARKSLPVGIAAILLSSAIHTSMMLFMIPLFLNAMRLRSSADNPRNTPPAWFWLLVAVAIGTLLASFQTLILGAIGDRRASYADTDLSAGPLLTLAWTMIGIVGAVLTRHRSTWPGMAAFFMLAMFTVSSMFGLYSHRYAAFFMPLMAMSIGGTLTPTANRMAFFGVYAAFSLVYFSFWL